jgi:hypothetical protein
MEITANRILMSSIFWDKTSCSPLKVNGLSGGTCRLHLQNRRMSQARNQREAGSKESSLHLQGSSETTRRYIPEDSILHNHRCENPKCYTG